MIIFRGIARLVIARDPDKEACRTITCATDSNAERLWAAALMAEISEFELFFESAKNWSVPDHRVQNDFHDYLSSRRIPFYVNDYLRKKLKNSSKEQAY